MMYFVVSYHRVTHAVSVETLDTSAAAMDRRFELERQRADPSLEIVTLAAESEDVLRATHGRYFLTASELASRMEQGAPPRVVTPRLKGLSTTR